MRQENINHFYLMDSGQNYRNWSKEGAMGSKEVRENARAKLEPLMLVLGSNHPLFVEEGWIFPGGESVIKYKGRERQCYTGYADNNGNERIRFMLGDTTIDDFTVAFDYSNAQKGVSLVGFIDNNGSIVIDFADRNRVVRATLQEKG